MQDQALMFFTASPTARKTCLHNTFLDENGDERMDRTILLPLNFEASKRPFNATSI
jgi:hypothetical protein